MASLKCDSMSTVLLCIFIHYSANVANAVECKRSCGYIAPHSGPVFNKTCSLTGFDYVYNQRIDWSDGSHSVIPFDFLDQLVIGSCCSSYQSTVYGIGIVTSGRFRAENARVVYNLRDERQTCNGCQSSAALSRITGETLLSIGTKGVGVWVECRGKVTVTYSPPLSSTNQTVVYSTIVAEFNDCSNCVQSC